MSTRLSNSFSADEVRAARQVFEQVATGSKVSTALFNSKPMIEFRRKVQQMAQKADTDKVQGELTELAGLRGGRRAAAE